MLRAVPKAELMVDLLVVQLENAMVDLTVSKLVDPSVEPRVFVWVVL